METSNDSHDVSTLASNQEEADTRILLHASEATLCGFKRIVVSCQDTDVLVMLVAFMPKLCQEVWLRCGTSRKRKFIAIHNITLPQAVRNSILQFHALTGSDTTSQFAGIGKRKAWAVFCSDGKAELIEGLLYLIVKKVLVAL